MKVTGIIGEYNPFHNGHLYHINKAKELTNPDLLVCVLSGNYNQRGDLSIMDKFKKTKVALENGIDLVVELPFICTCQNAYVFGSSAVNILKQLKTDSLVFGSETNNLEELNKYASLQIDITKLKELMHDGNSYPSAYGLLAGSLYPNDILAVSYLKALQGSNIEPFAIQRTNDYHSEDLSVIASASAIRKAIKNKIDYSMASSVTVEEPIFNEMLYTYLRNLLLTTSKTDLSNIFLVNEGIENLLKKNALLYNNYEDFLNNSISKRYTKSRIQRVLMMLANQVKKDDVKKLSELNYVRVLGFNAKGQEYLKQIKKDTNIVTLFKNIPEDYKEIEWKSSLIYSSLLKDGDAYLKQELKGPIII